MEIGEMMATFEKAIETYGADLQKQVAIEEMAELTKEICRNSWCFYNVRTTTNYVWH